MKMLKEFRDFISKGNVLDLAVAVIIGAAFGKIVTSFVNDILMPPIGILLGGVDFKDLHIVLKGSVTMNYGMFIQNIIDFLIIALCVFLVVKVANQLSKKNEDAPAVPAAPTKDQELLTEIRDLLKERK